MVTFTNKILNSELFHSGEYPTELLSLERVIEQGRMVRDAPTRLADGRIITLETQRYRMHTEGANKTPKEMIGELWMTAQKAVSRIHPTESPTITYSLYGNLNDG